MSRNYSGFATAVKSRFRPVASALGYVQLSPIIYARERNGWHEAFNLQAAGFGNDFFYVNYGVIVPNLCPGGTDRSILSCGHLLGTRLTDTDGTGAFPRGTIEEIEASAARILEQYRKLALPWFAALASWDDIAAGYLRVNSISEAQLGLHSSRYGAGPRCATYGYLLLKSGRTGDATRWLREAERILALPEYLTRDGRLVHEKEKFARLRKPEEYEVETLQGVRNTLQALADA